MQEVRKLREEEGHELHFILHSETLSRGIKQGKKQRRGGEEGGGRRGEREEMGLE